jgi:transposase
MSSFPSLPGAADRSPEGAGGLGSPTSEPVYAARYRHLTTREHNKLRPTQAQTVIAAAILRHLHAVITTGRTWDPAIATHGTRPRPEPAAA